MKKIFNIIIGICFMLGSSFSQVNLNLAWAGQVGARIGGDDESKVVAIDAAGNSYIAGIFTGSYDFDPGPGIAYVHSCQALYYGDVDVFVAKYDASGNFVWVKEIAGKDIQTPTGIAVDGSGNVYVSGYYGGKTIFSPPTSTVTIVSSGTSDIFIAKYDPSGNILWAESIGGLNKERAYSMTLDVFANIYLTGYFSSIADFDPSAATANLLSPGGTDAFVAKYDMNGNYIWAKSMGGINDDEGTSLTVDGMGNSYVTGDFNGTADFDPSASVANLISAGLQDAFIAKYDASGNYIWAKAISGAGVEQSNAIAIDPFGNSSITGYFIGTTDFDPSASTATVTSVNGTEDIFLAKYDALGNYLWVDVFGGNFTDIGRSLMVDAAGTNYVIGDFTGTIDFDPSASTVNLTATGSPDMFIGKYNSSGNYMLAKNIGNSGLQGSCIALDQSSNIFITGYIFGSNDMDPSAGTAILNSVLSGGIFIVKYDNFINYGWAKTLVDEMYSYFTPRNNNCNAIEKDAAGNIYATGSMVGKVDFDFSNATQFVSTLSDDIFIAKYGPTGNLLWAKCLVGVGTFTEAANAMALDASGNIYITGVFANTVDFDPSGATFNMSAIGGNDVFIAKYDNNGNFMWAKDIGGANPENATGISIDATNNVYITGYFQGLADFDPSASAANLTSTGLDDIFIAKYDASGNYVWAKNMGGTSADQSVALALDASNNIYICGFFNLIADFDPSASTANLTSNGIGDIFIAKYDPSGNYLWAKGMGSTTFDRPNSLVLDASGNVYVTGYFYFTVDFDPSAATANLISNGAADIFIGKYDALGNYVWAKNMGGQTVDLGSSITMDASGNLYLTGYFTGVADFDPSASVSSLTPAAVTDDIFIARYDASGNYVYANQIELTYGENPSDILITNSGEVVVSGYFKGIADFDISTTKRYNLINEGDRDFFIAKYDQQCSPIVLTTGTTNNLICAGETATLTVSGANTYTWSTSVSGASIVISPTITTSYTVNATDIYGCTDQTIITQSVSPCIGIKEITNSNSGMTIYPNPNNGNFKLEVSEDTQVEIYNVTGEIVYKNNFTKGTSQINLSDRANGVYILKASGKNSSGYSRIIKQ